MDKTLKTKLYQMFILGMQETELSQNPNLIKALKKGIGGVIFFTQNIKSETQFKNLTNNIKKEAVLPPFLAIDQEGGRVERTENIFGAKKYLSAKFAAEKGTEFVKSQTTQISRELKDWGINLNFAPCVDVNTNPKNPIIGERSFSNNAQEVVKFGKIVVDEYLENKIIPCIKHFPGHGDANVDSHLELPKIDLSLKEMKETHLKPFDEIASPMIMIAHMHCKCFDEKKTSTSLSKNAINYLRDEIGFDGVIISDDMIMGAILELIKDKTDKTYAQAELCAKAIKAGVNILLYRDCYNSTIDIIETLYNIAKVDMELQEKIDISYDKIQKIKLLLN